MTEHADKSGTVIDSAADLRERLARVVGADADAFVAIAAVSALALELIFQVVTSAEDGDQAQRLVRDATELAREIAGGAV